MTIDGERIADEGIYLEEDRFENPKELFKFIAGHLENAGYPSSYDLFDVGCATGEFLYYLGKRFPDSRFSGLDVSQSMIEYARTRNSAVDFRAGSALDAENFGDRKFDIVTSIGMLECFGEEQVAQAIENILSAVKEGGSAFLFSTFNDYPIDVIMKCRRVTEEDAGIWESGWNLFSRLTVERILKSLDYQLSWSWAPWEMPLAIPKREDQMRTWTIKTEENPFQRVTGARLWVHDELLHVRVEKIGK